MAIPARFRDGITTRCGGNLFGTMDSDEPCILLYPAPDWEGMARRLMRLSGRKPAIRREQRRMVGRAFEMDMDSHGRILIPAKLREKANLTKQAVLVGQGSKFELWDEQGWNDWCDASDDADDDLPPELESLLI